MKEHMYCGIHESSWGGKWLAMIRTGGGNRKYLGTFPDPESAARAYDKAVLQYRGEGAKLNFPQERPPS